MVSSLKYKNSSTFAINLSGDNGLYGQTALKIRGYAWDYSTGDHALAGVSRSAREADLEIIAYREEGRRSLDTLIEQSTLDMDIQKPGILFIDDWQTDCYIPKIEISTVNPQYIKATLTIVLLNGVWRRGVTTMLQANTATPATSTFLDYPHGYPYDYLRPKPTQYVSNPMPYSVPVSIIYYGPATNPYISIGSNSYKISGVLQEGERIAVNPYDHTVTKIEVNGRRSNVFSSADRGSGIGSGRYIFQPIESGANPVSKIESHKVDVTVWQERMTPPLSSTSRGGIDE